MLPTPNWFVAIPAPDQALLPKAMPPGLRLFGPADLHLTVAFLGAMPPERAGAVVAQMRQVQFAPFALVPSQWLALPSPERVSALALAVGEGHAQAVALMQAWRESFWAAAGATPDPRPPLPHLTVARPDRRAGAVGQAAALAWLATAPVPTARIWADRLALYTWHPDRQHQQFMIVDQVSLSAKG
jgi:RNA 2',3'-cyclic 3'-phosphodiesterase